MDTVNRTVGLVLYLQEGHYRSLALCRNNRTQRRTGTTDTRLRALGLEGVECGGGGQCGFLSVTHQMFGTCTPALAQQLRTTTVAWVVANWEYFRKQYEARFLVLPDDFPATPEAYHQMVSPSTYFMTDAELLAVCLAFRMNIHVWTHNDHYVFRWDNPEWLHPDPGFATGVATGVATANAPPHVPNPSEDPRDRAPILALGSPVQVRRSDRLRRKRERERELEPDRVGGPRVRLYPLSQRPRLF